MRALRDEVILRPEPLPKMRGLLHLPDRDVPDGPVPAVVEAVGPEADPDIEVGARVYFRSRSARSAVFERDDVTYARVVSSEIDAVIES